MNSATASMTAKVTRYWTSLTAKEICGGTKKKSNSATLAKLARMVCGRPKNAATNTTASRKSITVLARSSVLCKGQAINVVSAQAASASRYRCSVENVYLVRAVIAKPRKGIVRSTSAAPYRQRIVCACRCKNGVN